MLSFVNLSPFLISKLLTTEANAKFAVFFSLLTGFMPPGSALWIKLIRTSIAILFSPIYLFYIFLRVIVFKQYYNVK